MSLSESVVLQEQGQLQHEQLHLQIKGKSFHHLGLKTHRIPMSLFRKNRQRLLSRYQLASSSGSLIVLKGGEGLTRHATDSEPLFRQESFFFWAFGVIEPDCFATIDITTGESTLYVPRLPESYAVWMGHIKSLEEFKEIYQVDKVLYENQFDQSLSELTPTKIILLEGTNSDSGLKHVPASHPSLSQFLDGNKDQCEIDKSSLFHHMSDLRAVKTEEELAVLRYTNLISSGAHVQVMRTVRPGMMEYQLEANFNRFCYFHGGCRQNAYTCICGSGINSSVLHYGHATAPNDRLIGENDMLLLDMGGEYFCFASDITCSYPSSGKFSKDQRDIYETVLAAQKAVLAAAKPGVSWLDMHALTERTILTELKQRGFLRGEIDEMMEHRISYLFMPHGLGHLMGLDVHDVGGYLDTNPSRSDKIGQKGLRTARIIEPGMVLTVEPGVYFIKVLLLPALEKPETAKFLVKEKIQQFLDFGGIRLEDNIIVTDSGVENMTKVPREVEDVERVMAGGKWIVDDLLEKL